MNTRQRFKKMVSLLVVFAMVIGILPSNQLFAATVNETIAEWNWTAYPTFPANATGGEYKESASLTYSNKAKNTANTYSKDASIATNNWQGGGQYWLLTVPKEGYSNLKLTFYAYGSGTGPKDFQVQVSTDNSNFIDVPDGNYTLTTSSQITLNLVKENLPIATADSNNADIIYIKLLNTSKYSIGDATKETASGGTSRLYNVKITGDKTEAGGGTVDETKVSTVTANPLSGEIFAGTQINLSTQTTSAAIYYVLNNGEITTGSAITLNGSDFVGTPGTAVIKAWATKEGLIDSDEITFTYTKKIEVPLDVISIAQARAQATGTAIVKGTVTRAIQSSGTNKTNCTLYIQDDTGGIAVFTPGIELGTYPEGTKVKVTGVLGIFNGTLQLKPTLPSDLEVLNGESVVPRLPENITISQLNTKNYEGRLVKISGVRLDTIGQTSNHTIVDEQTNTSVVMRCTDGLTLPNTFKPGDGIDVIGIAGNNKGTPQLLVSKVDDITKGVMAPVTPVTALPDTNGTVPLGGKVTLSTVTTGASIICTLNGGAEQIFNSSTATITVDAFNQPGNKAVIKAKATKGDYTTPEKTFTYAQAQVPKVVSSLPVGAVNVNSQVKLTTTPANAVIKYIITKKSGQTDEASDPEAIYSNPIVLTADMFPVKITAWATAENYLPSEKVVLNYRLKVEGEAKNYFGQLHSHTAENSDGAGTLVEAYEWARDMGKLDFFAVTDHSNAFDQAAAGDLAGTYNLGAYNANNVKWQNGKTAAANACTPDFLGVYAYEMTWSGGPGHMNTFNTEGFVSRNNKELNNKTNDAGLKAYYELLKQTPNSISQFNHPGKTFGTFSGFGYWDPVIDQRISLIEVGNGEGAVGSGGYFASYNEYNQALDKGWHLAPTNNQDNHKKGWGTANSARTVIHTNDFTIDGMYQALREMRVYATEDNNLDIVYTLNNEPLGTIMSNVPDQAAFNVEVKDPDSSDAITSISIISNGGKAVYTQNFDSQDAILNYAINNPKSGYYYIKVVQKDGQIAVTAPIWLGTAAAVGISEVSSSAVMPVTTEALTLSTELFNNEKNGVVLKSINYAIEGDETIASDTPNQVIGSNQNYIHKQIFIPSKAGNNTVIVTAILEIAGEERAFTSEIDLNVRDIGKLVFVGIDASHYNEYVSGNYQDSMGNFGKLAAQYDVRTVELRTSDELIAALNNPKYQMMVFTAPSRRNGTTGRVPYATYSEKEIKAIADYAKTGKTLVIAGWADYYENYSNVKNDGLEMHMAGQQNKLLQAIGSSLRISDDGALDDKNNGGQAPRLYLTNYNEFISPLTKGIAEGQVYSNYGGATIHAINPDGTPALTLPSSVLPMVSGHETTYSKDQDSDGIGFADKTVTVPKYNDRVLLTASETLNYPGEITSQVVVSGAAFMSNFEIQATVENAGTLNYSNYNILENIIKSVNPTTITPIAEVKTAPAGTRFTIEGIATSSVYNGTDENKGFFDCIYVQDTTGGINLFPVAQGVEAGQKIRVTGTVSAYQGETQLAVSKVEVIDNEFNPVQAKQLTTKEAMLLAHTGELVKVKGKVKSVVKDKDGVVGQIIVDDGSGPTIVYINGYITKGKKLPFVSVGKEITAVGLASVGENFQSETEFLPRLRVRDRGEIVDVTVVTPPDNGGSTSNNGGSTNAGGGGIITVPGASNTVIVQMQPTFNGTQASITMSAATINDAIKVAEATAGSGAINMVLQVASTVGMSSMELGLPLEAIKAITTSKVDTLTLETPMGMMSLDKKVLDTLAKQAQGNFKINFTMLEGSGENRPVYEFSITSGDKAITTFGDGAVTISLPYASRQGEKESQLVIYYIRDNGEKEVIKNSNYNEMTQTISFDTNHFSKYMIDYANKQFKDVSTEAWYSEAVDYVAAREIITGMDTDRFAPDAALTRAQFLVMLMRAYNVAIDQNLTDNFVDGGATYYTPYLATAKKLGFVKGNESNCFKPNVPISRQDMFVMLYNVLKETNNIPTTLSDKNVTQFNDYNVIDSYAKEAINDLVKAGIVNGSDGKLMIKDTATRAYAAQLIYNLRK